MTTKIKARIALVFLVGGILAGGCFIHGTSTWPLHTTLFTPNFLLLLVYTFGIVAVIIGIIILAVEAIDHD